MLHQCRGFRGRAGYWGRWRHDSTGRSRVVLLAEDGWEARDCNPGPPTHPLRAVQRGSAPCYHAATVPSSPLDLGSPGTDVAFQADLKRRFAAGQHWCESSDKNGALAKEREDTVKITDI